MTDFLERFVSEQQLQLADAQIDADLKTGEAYRADLIFYEVDHSRASYEGRVFFNNPDANAETPKDPDQGYVGSYYVFGHGPCYGGPGHCNPNWGEEEDAIDFAFPHKLHPEDLTVTITDAVKRMADKLGDGVTVTVVPALAAGAKEERPLLKFDRIQLVTYE